ncbi:hypothetical protein RN001_008566 [Aquatica leii]|uniref:Uncharacterized protein n=1 Tax=Aquatica leii TaxID=1421715 RepID=A0AAN7P4E7_9COLE|nr:hypothetical protein RN001_008566 [Aquatica leii]
MTIYDIPGIVAIPLSLSATPNNISGGFRVSGISPFNGDIFTESEFIALYVTDRPDPITNKSGNIDIDAKKLKPLPKTSPRNTNTNNRRKRRSAILTDTPVKGELERQKHPKKSKRRKQMLLRKMFLMKKMRMLLNKVSRKKEE